MDYPTEKKEKKDDQNVPNENKNRNILFKHQWLLLQEGIKKQGL